MPTVKYIQVTLKINNIPYTFWPHSPAHTHGTQPLTCIQGVEVLQGRHPSRPQAYAPTLPLTCIQGVEVLKGRHPCGVHGAG